jgi:L-fuconolactonase
MAQSAPNPNYHVRHDWLARRSEEVLEPDLPIVDPHHHLWDRAETGRYLLDDLLGDLNSGHNIIQTVFLQCHSMHRADGPEEMRPVGEVEFVNGVAAMSASGNYGKTRICAGIVGTADLALGGAVEQVLEAETRAGGGRFRGIRYITATDAKAAEQLTQFRKPGLLLDAKVREGFARLGALGLSFDAWLYHPQLPELTDLARAFPETPIVLNHVGGAIGLGPYAGQRDAVFAEWSGHIRALGACPNVYVKLGGLGMRMFGFDVQAQDLPPTSERLAELWRPYLETCIAAFGVERSMFESNFPVDKTSCSYRALWNAFKRVASGCSAAEKAALFSGTATRFYRL